jgi:prepilin-type N-terminal cleavage/methylation domain-containing protein
MFTTPRNRVAQDRGFTLIELLVVLVILSILIAIAASSSLGFRDRGDKAAAQADVRALAPSVESWSTDNSGTAGDVDGDASTSGYQGMTLDGLKNTYDQALDASPSSPYSVPPAGFTDTKTDYCIAVTVAGWTAFKHGPNGRLGVTKSASFSGSSCQ